MRRLRERGFPSPGPQLAHHEVQPARVVRSQEASPALAPPTATELAEPPVRAVRIKEVRANVAWRERLLVDELQVHDGREQVAVAVAVRRVRQEPEPACAIKRLETCVGLGTEYPRSAFRQQVAQ